MSYKEFFKDAEDESIQVLDINGVARYVEVEQMYQHFRDRFIAEELMSKTNPNPFGEDTN